MSVGETISRAADFHGHLGPFLVIGVRMGLAGLRELGACASYQRLCITASLPLRVPFSCIVDGLQISTKCTIGNQKLMLRRSEGIQAEFKAKQRMVAVCLRDSFLEELEARLQPSGIPDQRIRQLASEVAGTPEQNLFTIEQRTPQKAGQLTRGERMNDLRIAKRRLKQLALSLVFVKNSRVVFETDREGLRGFLQAIDTQGGFLSGASVADKIVGKAAALLCVYSRIKAVFATAMSQPALGTLEANGIRCEYETLVPTILNRKKTGTCPFEELVEDAAGPEDALQRIRRHCG